MKGIREALVETLVTFSVTYARKSDQEIAELTIVWENVISDVKPLTPGMIKAAALELLRTENDWFPKPASLRAILMRMASEERDKTFRESFRKQALPLLEGEPLTDARRLEILSGISPGARSLMEAITKP